MKISKKVVAVLIQDNQIIQIENELPTYYVEQKYNFYIGCSQDEKPIATLRRHLKTYGIKLIILDNDLDPICVIENNNMIYYYYLINNEHYVGSLENYQLVNIDDLSNHKELQKILKILSKNANLQFV